MKQISAQLLNLLQSRGRLERADLLEIDLPNQMAIYAVIGKWDLVWNGTTYYVAQYGSWERGTVVSSADFSCESNGVTLSVVALDSVVIPGTSVSLMSAISNGFFDGAGVKITTAYMPAGQWGNIVGTMALFSGTIISAQRVGRSKAEFEARDWLYLLNQKVPLRVIQPSCAQTLFDAGCGLNAANYAFGNTVASGSTQEVIIPANAWPTTDVNGRNPQNSNPPYFQQGKLQFTSGQNKNLWGHIAVQTNGATGALYLAQPMPFPVAVGDTFVAYPGCSKTVTACAGFNNLIHFTGFPYVPPPETSV